MAKSKTKKRTRGGAPKKSRRKTPARKKTARRARTRRVLELAFPYDDDEVLKPEASEYLLVPRAPRDGRAPSFAEIAGGADFDDTEIEEARKDLEAEIADTVEYAVDELGLGYRGSGLDYHLNRVEAAAFRYGERVGRRRARMETATELSELSNRTWADAHARSRACWDGWRFRHAIRAERMTLGQLAASIGEDLETVETWTRPDHEEGAAVPDSRQVGRIANALGRTASWLLGQRNGSAS